MTVGTKKAVVGTKDHHIMKRKLNSHGEIENSIEMENGNGKANIENSIEMENDNGKGLNDDDIVPPKRDPTECSKDLKLNIDKVI